MRKLRLLSQADVRCVVLMAMVSIAGLVFAIAGSSTGDLLEDSWKGSHGLSTNVVAGDSLAGWWQVNEISGVTAADRSTNGLSLSLAAVDGSVVPAGASEAGGTLWKTGLFDGGMDLGGLYYLGAQVVGVPGQGAYGLGGDFSFSAWVKTGVVAGPGDEQVIARWVDSHGHGWELGTATNGQLVARFRTDAAAPGGGVEQVVQGALIEGIVKDGGWHQAGVVYVGATGEARVYLDGRIEAARVIAGSFGSSVAVGQFQIGNKGWGVDSWKGSVDEIRLYKKALSDAEMASLPVTLSDVDGDGLSTLQEQAAGTHPGQRD